MVPWNFCVNSPFFVTLRESDRHDFKFHKKEHSLSSDETHEGAGVINGRAET